MSNLRCSRVESPRQAPVTADGVRRRRKPTVARRDRGRHQRRLREQLTETGGATGQRAPNHHHHHERGHLMHVESRSEYVVGYRDALRAVLDVWNERGAAAAKDFCLANVPVVGGER
ncbi:hypothetical protein I5J36_gp56 [Mycobacterium phage Mendokysei]|uniref:Uncharacterized protein n=4 Tax=Caudoviricetes TaxID=2731619 RepID=A0A2P1CGB0_9CAUD|nr:hypothetical protein I5J36_gp56 [Mycobacterium phage Mendokysei]AVJ50272.1 hypothetical protein SEA_MENDOKYSEI_56 [Mycobacterium phage Mendokysei]